ncbi:MAG: hypothetical protein JXA09_13740, partial [Anaerolineae bacterium]|nr:hypothetical protein [Anaerolineae bacterium]
MVRLGAPLIVGALLVGTLVLLVRAGDAPVGAAPATRGPGTPLLGETLQRAALSPTQPVTSTYYFPLIFRQWFEPIDYYEPFNWPPVSGWQYGSVRNVVTVHEEFIYGQK